MNWYIEPARGRNPAFPEETAIADLRISKIRQRFGLVGPLASIVAELAYGAPRFNGLQEMNGIEQFRRSVSSIASLKERARHENGH